MSRTKTVNRFLERFRIILCILFISACTALPEKMIASKGDLALPITISAEAEYPGEKLSTPVIPAAITDRDQTPILFTFPDSGPIPISMWRPPLYEVPWALGPYDHFLFVRPIAADEVNWPLADYRYGGIFPKTTIIHTGIDIDAPLETPVLAAAPGKVIWAGYGLYRGDNNPDDPYGLAVTIRHDFGYQGKKLYTVYAHMKHIDVITGQSVTTGTQLGIVGITGATTGPHLHFEVRIESNNFYTTRNPELWLSPPQGWGVLAGRVLNTNGSILSNQQVFVRSRDTGQEWMVMSYGQTTVNSDEYYRENLVLSDLPDGNYQLTITYEEKKYSLDISIHPGSVSYFTFQGRRGFNTALPALPPSETWLKYTN